jgi:two-component system cell cycle response regulator CpdR
MDRAEVHRGFTFEALGWGFTITVAGAPMPRILLAEDDDSLRGFLARALERAGYEVLACADGEEASAALDETWDLLLTDIVMPGIDGIEVARRAAAKHPGLRIMFITGFAAVALAAGESAPAGAKVLSKPIHLREIVSEVERMMAA